MDKQRLLDRIQSITTLYSQYLHDLDTETGHEPGRDRAIALAGIHSARKELERLLILAESRPPEAPIAHLLRLAQVNINNLDSWRTVLLERMGAPVVRQALLEALRIYVHAYQETVRLLALDYQRLSPGEFEEYQMDDQLMYAELLTHRDIIDLLLLQLPQDTIFNKDVMRSLAEVDQILREGGRVYLQPLLRSGIIQRGREARFEPKERWWHYLDVLQEFERRDGCGGPDPSGPPLG